MSKNSKNKNRQEGKGKGERDEAPVFKELSLEQSPLDWSVHVANLPDNGISGEKSAMADELAAVTKMLNDVHDLQVVSLSCRYLIRSRKLDNAPGEQGCRGRFSLVARLAQTCVVTLEAMETLIEEEFEQDFTTASAAKLSRLAQEDELEDPFASEPPRSLQRGHAIFGPLVYEYLSLAIDPNPRRQGAQFEGQGTGAGQGAETARPSPFAALKHLSGKK